MSTRTAFVLTGGGSLGAVQVGMLQALGEEGIEPDLLVGTSAGAVNTAWVAGHGTSRASLERLAALWTQVSRRDLFPVSAASLLQAVLGRGRSLSSSAPLGDLVRERAGVQRLEHAVVPVHLMASDILTGLPVALTQGRVDDAVRASAAIPGIFPPVLLGGRWLVDGGVACAAGVAQAVDAGADEVWVLPTGYPCALPTPPGTPLGMALHAFTLLLHHRLLTEVAGLSGDATIRVLPPLCPLAVSAADFGRAAELTDRGLLSTRHWLRSGRTDAPHQESVLSLHEHRGDLVAATTDPNQKSRGEVNR
jgi:NTE family protein